MQKRWALGERRNALRLGAEEKALGDGVEEDDELQDGVGQDHGINEAAVATDAHDVLADGCREQTMGVKNCRGGGKDKRRRIT
jgi:hypothetical protein